MTLHSTPASRVSHRILCVDDEQRVVDALERTLSDNYEVDTFTDPTHALDHLQQHKNYAVILSDMRMPGMDGADFLAHARTLAPDATRVLLTGHSDLNDATRAVNAGGLYRLLLKPCAAEDLLSNMQGAVDHHLRMCAERKVLEESLNGTIKALTDALALAAPTAFRAAATARHAVVLIATARGWPDRWKMEAAAMLAPIGCLAVPGDIVDRAYRGQVLTPPEHALFRNHPEMGKKLIAAIPRLEDVAAIVGLQAAPAPVSEPPDFLGKAACAVRFAIAAAQEMASGRRGVALSRALSQRLSGFDALLLRDAASLLDEPPPRTPRVIKVSALRTGMVLIEDVKSKTGALLMAAGQQLTEMHVERLQRFHAGVGVTEPIVVEGELTLARLAV